jgi:predicted amidophosphoribosyltransferase
VTNVARRSYKEHAIETVATGLRKAMTQENAERMTWVPMPPSKVLGHPDHDDRLTRIMAKAFNDYDADIRPLLRQTSSTEADHNAASRLTPDALYALTEVDRSVLNACPVRQVIVLFDDVLTTRKHFKCCERRLRETVATDVPIIGVFIARRILPDTAAEFDVLT